MPKGQINGSMWWLAAIAVFGLIVAVFYKPPSLQCAFDRNEVGPKGDYGQWYWEIYKCGDGTERRELVAGPRG